MNDFLIKTHLFVTHSAIRMHIVLAMCIAISCVCVSTEIMAQVGDGPTGSFSEADLDDSLIRNAVGNLFRLIEGAFGALIMVVAGILAIVAAAMGNYRAALGMLVVALGAFILRALVSLFFGTEFDAFQQ